MNYETTKVYPNEVVKADDFEFGFDAQIDNISRALQGVLEARQDFIVNGYVTPYYQGGMNISMAQIFGVCASTGLSFLNTEKTEPIPISQADVNETRIDILEVRASEEEFDEQQRSFSDFETNVNELRYVATKKRFLVETKVKVGTPGNATAPEKDSGWVKIAEIVIPAGTTEITTENIKNITSDIAEMENNSWTNEKTVTYNMGYISDINSRFRHQHNADGTHKENIIGDKELKTGTNTGDVNGNTIPVGTSNSVSGSSFAASNTIANTISLLAGKITDLFNSYLKYGAFNFNGELVIGNIIDNNSIVSPLKIGAASDGTAYLKIGNKDILNITVTGQIRMPSGYTATATNDLVTKSVTDALSYNLSSLTERVNDIVENLDSTIYANNVLSRFKFSSQSIDVATTTNIDQLYGLFTVDGISLTVGMVVLVKDQTNKVNNGIYTVSESAWTRKITSADNLKHKFFKVNSGTTNANKIFYTPLENFTIGESQISFSESILRSTNTPSTIPYRDTNGSIQVSSPTNANDAVNKSYVDNFVNQTKNIADEAVTPQKFSGVLPIAKGGTGATTAKEAQYNLLKDMNDLTTGVHPNFVDDTPIICMYGNLGDKTIGSVYKRNTSALWKYIQNKISLVLGLTSANYNGTALKATHDANGDTISTTYAKKNNVWEHIGFARGGNTPQRFIKIGSIPVSSGTVNYASLLFSFFCVNEDANYPIGTMQINISSGAYSDTFNINGYSTVTISDVNSDTFPNVRVTKNNNKYELYIITTYRYFSFEMEIKKNNNFTFENFEQVPYSETGETIYSSETQTNKIVELNKTATLNSTVYGATSDGDGNNIASTYAKKSELSNYDTVYVGSTAPSTTTSYKLWVQS